MALIRDPGWILTKRSVMDKIGALMGELSDAYRAETGALPAELRGGFPKLSRGENYKGLPYMILDYPALFGREHVFAVRTLFWWGHYFSLTLHLKGRYRERYAPSLPWAGDWYVAVSEDEWAHDVGREDYKKACDLSEGELGRLDRHPFFKMAAVISLEEWDGMYDLLEARFREVMGWLA